jgi:hypothetical protein
LFWLIIIDVFPLFSALQLTVEENIVERRKIMDVQTKLTLNLQSQFDNLQSSMDALKSLTRETIKLQYQMLPSRYLLVVDGKRANPRKHVARLVSMFCQFRRTTLLAMAMGTWKILLKHEESVAKRPQYAKAAALHLMVGWVQNIKYKQMNNFAHRWIAAVQCMIFRERSLAVLPLQTLYRVWRDRRKFIRMHKMATYDGPLSDIYLAPPRNNVTFFIPLVIRTGRRAVWFAAVTIQSAWKSSRYWRIYQVRRRQVVLIQSIGRMWPKRVYFLRLRATAIKCQAWMRRTVKLVQFRRLRKCTIIVQKYVRRYLATLLKWRKFREIWTELERMLAAAIRIQCRWRIHVASRRVQRKKDYIKRRLWAVLTLQRCWYKSKGAFHTFLLMCCYRGSAQEDERFNQHIAEMGRSKAAKKIQRTYRALYRRRLISAVIKVQCWYRGRLGYNLVDILRQQKWASRKLHHWARGMMRWKHKRARQIQCWWWKQRTGRMRRHIHYHARLMDEAEDKELALAKYRYASLIQAFAHGVWSRRWTRRHKAAITIQKPLKFFLARKRWKRELKERSLGAVTRFVSSLLSRAVRDRTTYLVKLHSVMMIKVQALVRGFNVRCCYFRALAYAYKLGVSVVKVQRFWRRSGNIVKAVEELMAIRRHELNPFKDCDTMHAVLLKLRDETNRYYSSKDPRVGLTITNLLHRIGHSELAGMFPKKNYLYVKDISHMKMEKMIDLYNSWQKKKHGNTAQPQAAATSSKGNAHQKRTEPVDLFQLIIDIVRPPLNTRKVASKQHLQMTAAVQEIFSPQDCFEYIFNAFGKRFGKNFVARATNTAITITESAWTGYSNFKSITDPLTPGQLLRGINTAPGGSEVKSSLDVVRKIELKTQKEREAAEEEKRWDRERVKLCAELLQFAIDRLRAIVDPETPLAEMIEKTLLRVASYKRKYSYNLLRLRARIEAKNAKAAADAAAAQQNTKAGKKKPSKAATKNTGDGEKMGPPKATAEGTAGPKGASTKMPSSFVAPDGAVEGEHHEDIWTMSLENRLTAYSVEKSVELEFTGKGEDSIEMEKNVCICKLFLDLLDNFYNLTLGVQKLKRIWRGDAVARAISKRKLDKFLDKATAEYLAYLHNNHVHAVWSKFRKIETTAYRLALIMDAVIRKKNAINEELSLVPRWGWTSYPDENGYTYWLHDKGKEESTYEMPVYRFDQYRHILRIQKRARMLLRALALRRALKETARQREIALIEERRAKEAKFQKTTSRALFVSLRIRKRLMSQFLYGHEDGEDGGHEHDHDHEASDAAAAAAAAQHADQSVPAPEPARRNSLTGVRRPSLTKPVGENTVVIVPLGIDPEMESLLPTKLRIVPAKPIFSGGWFLYQSTEELHGHRSLRYDVVLACKVREGGKLCDIKFTTGKKMSDVKAAQLFQLNYEQGSAVEARFKGELDFYRGKITSITAAHDGNNRYAVLYDDGEKEFGLTGDMLRIPSNALHELLKERTERIAKLEKQLMRARHFARLKADRISRCKRVAQSAMDTVRGILQGKPAQPIQNLLSNVKSAALESGAAERTDREEQTTTAAAPPPRKTMVRKASMAGGPMTVKAQSDSALIGLTAQNMMMASDILKDMEAECRISVKYIRVLRYGWIPVKKGTVVEYHRLSDKALKLLNSSAGRHFLQTHMHTVHPPVSTARTNNRAAPHSPHANPNVHKQHSLDEPEEIRTAPPVYTASEEFAAVKMQTVVRLHIGRLRFKRELFKDSPGIIMNRAILRAKRTAYIGFGQEGLNTFLLLRRLGLWELADALEVHFLSKVKKAKDNTKDKATRERERAAAAAASAPSLDKLAQLTTKELEGFGIKKQELVHELIKFQNWWNKTNQAGREAASVLVNYYSDVQDSRPLRECIRDKEEYIVSRFLAFFPSHEARTRVAVHRVVQSLYPHGHQQIESFIQKYLQSPELARVRFFHTFFFCYY